MWRNPKYTTEAPEPAAPVEQGERLATYQRGKDAELRVNLAEFNGSPFLALRVWERGQDGAWWPVKGKGCSIRIAECADLAEVLARVGSGSSPRPARQAPARETAAPRGVRSEGASARRAGGAPGHSGRADPPFEPSARPFNEFEGEN